MYCHNCGAKLPNEASFCTECGKPVARSASGENTQLTLGGTLIITRKYSDASASAPVEIWINGACNRIIQNGETVSLNLATGEYVVTLKQLGVDVLSQLVEIRNGSTEQVIYAPKYSQFQATPNTRAVAGNNTYYQQPPVQVTQHIIVNGNGRAKDKWIAFLLCLFLGYIGAHKFYEGKIGQGILYLVTMGIFGVGWLIDTIILLCKPNPYYV